MSSSSDIAVRSRVLRDVPSSRPVLVELHALASGPTGASRVDPAVLAEALAEATVQGYRDGYAEGSQAGKAAAAAAAAEHADQVATVVAALERAAASLATRQTTSLAEVEDAVVGAAFELATALLGRELELAAAPGRDALARALRLAPPSGPVIARLHPDDLSTVGSPDELAPGRAVALVSDIGVERGGCVVEVGDARIDAQLGSALRRVEEVLSQ